MVGFKTTATFGLLITLAANNAVAKPFTFSYAGRLADGQNRGIVGPINLELKFYTVPSGGSSIPVSPTTYPAVNLSDGTFQVDISQLSQDEVNMVFGTSNDAWVEVTDHTHNVVYPRQRMTATPYALKIPVDGSTVTYDSHGNLTVIVAGGGVTPAAGGIVNLDGNARLPSVDGSQLTNVSATTVGGQSATAVAAAVASVSQASVSPVRNTLVMRDNSGNVLATSVEASALTLNSGTKSIGLAAPSGLGSSVSYILPAAPVSGAYLQTDGSGVMSWSTMTGSASGSSSGSLSASDWTSFNNRLPQIGGTMSGALNMGGQSLTGLATPTGGSDAATKSYVDTTFVKTSGGTMSGPLNHAGQDDLNIGNLAMTTGKVLTLSGNTVDPSGLSAGDKGKMWFNSVNNQIKYFDGSTVQSVGASGAGITSLNGLSISGQTFANGSSGTSPQFNSSGSIHTLNIPLASGASVTGGLLSNSDYSTFSAKLSGVSNGPGISSSMSAGTASISLAAVGSAGTYVKVVTDSYGRVTGALSLTSADLPVVSASGIVTGTLSVLNGGTGSNTFTNNGVIIGSGPSALSSTAAGSQYNVMTVNGSNQPVFGTVNLASGNAVTGLLPTAAGGTGLGATGSSNQILGMTSGGGVLEYKTINGTPNQITVSNSAGSLTLATPQAIHTSASPTFSTVNLSGSLGLGNNNPTTILDVNGALTERGIAAPAVSANGQGVLYFDSTLGHFRVSENGAAFQVLGSGGGGTATVTVGVGLISTAGTISLGTVGAAGTYAKVITDSYGRVIGSAALLSADLPPADASTITTGTLAVSNGGTGLNSAPSSGQLLIGNGTGYTLSALSSGTTAGVSIVPSAGGITLDTVQDIRTTSSPTFKGLQIGSATSGGSVGITSTSSGAGATLVMSSSGAGQAAVMNINTSSTTGSSALNITSTGTGANANLTVSVPNASSGASTLNLAIPSRTYQVSASAATNGFSIYDTSIGAARLFIDAAGNVGIGTSTPAGKLDVYGAICFSGSNCMSSWPAGASGANSTITSLTGLTTALSISQGGSGATTAAGARTGIGAAASGANSDISSLTGLTSQLPVSEGGSGTGNFTAKGVLFGNGSSPLLTTGSGSQYQVLTAGGGGTPVFASLNLASSAAVSGSLPVTYGGTGASTLTSNAVLLGNGTSAVQTVAPGSAGNVLSSNGSTWTSTPGLNLATPGPIGGSSPGSGAFTALTTTGTVGIGTTSPAGSLEVNSSGYHNLVVNPSGNPNNVGIGTTTPYELLHLVASNVNGGVGMRITNSGSDSQGWEMLEEGSGNGTYPTNSLIFRNTGVGGVMLMMDPNTGFTGIGESMTVLKNTLDVSGGMALGTYAGVNTAGTGNLILPGKIGIGTSVPTSPLQVVGGPITAQGLSSPAGIPLVLTGGNASVGIGTTAPLSALDVNGGIAVGAYAGNATATSGNIIVSGSLGIGTGNPQSNLQVAGSMQVNLRVANSSGTNAATASDYVIILSSPATGVTPPACTTQVAGRLLVIVNKTASLVTPSGASFYPAAAGISASGVQRLVCDGTYWIVM